MSVRGRRLVASLVVQYSGTTLEKVLLVAIVGLGRGHVDLVCVLMDHKHIMQNSTNVLCRI